MGCGTIPRPKGNEIHAYSNLEATLLADSVAPKDISPINIDHAFQKLGVLKPHIKIFWKNGVQRQHVTKTNEADIGSFSAGRMAIIEKKGVSATYSWNRQILDLDYLRILKGPKHKEAYEYISKEKAQQMPTYENNMETAVLIDRNWYVEHGKKVSRRWETWQMQ